MQERRGEEPIDADVHIREYKRRPVRIVIRSSVQKFARHRAIVQHDYSLSEYRHGGNGTVELFVFGQVYPTKLIWKVEEVPDERETRGARGKWRTPMRSRFGVGGFPESCEYEREEEDTREGV